MEEGKMRKKCKLIILIMFLFNLLVCASGASASETVNGSTSKERTLNEMITYPFTAEVLVSVLEDVDLEWKITDEQSGMENQRIFTLSNSNNSIVASVSASGDTNGRSLMFGFMSKRNEPLDQTNNIQTPITEEEFLKVLEMAALLYGGFENKYQIAEDYQKNFIEKSEIRDVDSEKYFTDSMTLTYSQSGKWESKYNDIYVRTNFGYISNTGEIDFQSIGLYNSGDHILFMDDMEKGEIFEAKPEITINQITEEVFISAYRDETTEFSYNQKPGDYVFYEVHIKDVEYCPNYPFEVKMYFGVNLSETQNNIDRLLMFEEVSENYYFDPLSVNYGVSIVAGASDEKILKGRFEIKKLVLKDETGEVVQQKKYNYITNFEINILG